MAEIFIADASLLGTPPPTLFLVPDWKVGVGTSREPRGRGVLILAAASPQTPDGGERPQRAPSGGPAAAVPRGQLRGWPGGGVLCQLRPGVQQAGRSAWGEARVPGRRVPTLTVYPTCPQRIIHQGLLQRLLKSPWIPSVDPVLQVGRLKSRMRDLSVRQWQRSKPVSLGGAYWSPTQSGVETWHRKGGRVHRARPAPEAHCDLGSWGQLPTALRK